ncbi:MAG: hypothetical protein CK540_07755 [Thermoleophilia bacterium]|nr:MAG: hypothetical protein CK540_07755 [Thermoleophilia bacterium]
MIDPVGCLGCACLYAYDAKDGRRYVGCVERVHASEVDLGVLEQYAAEQRVFGGLRALRVPLPICSAAIDSAYPRRLPEIGCVNPEFYEPPGGGTFVVRAHDEPSQRDV